MTERDSMEFDVVIVGAGPAGLSCAIQLKKEALRLGQDLSVCLLEKGAEVGAHILSGAVIETRALEALIPDWQAKGAPLLTPATHDEFVFLTKRGHFSLPVPKSFRNEGNYIVSLGLLCRWLAKEAETLGVEIYPGFAGAEVLYGAEGEVVGVATGDMGVEKSGSPGPQFQRGMALYARQTIFAEGCRGSLTKDVIARFNLREGCDPQTYGLGVKEIWEIPPQHARPGHIMHTIGWPLPSDTYGGSWLYHMDQNRVSIGFVVGLDFSNPTLSPYQEFQTFKTHPFIRDILKGGKRVAYGARALSEGGYQSIPKLTFPGGLLIGDSAGFLNVPKIKGTHTAMQSGIEAAIAIAEVFQAGDLAPTEITLFSDRIQQSWLFEELYRARNIRPGFQRGLALGLIHAAIDSLIFRGRAPWTLHHHADHTTLKPLKAVVPRHYPKPDGEISFDRASSVHLANTQHDENQPIHLKLRQPALAIETNLAVYGSPESHYCPAGVYEIVYTESNAAPRLLIQAQNCVHCKSCDIKDPTQNIDWSVPEGGSGPQYSAM